MGSEVLTVLSINLIVCWGVTPYSWMHNADRSYESKSSNFRFQNNL
jgi:hypothetical protein